MFAKSFVCALALLVLPTMVSANVDGLDVYQAPRPKGTRVSTPARPATPRANFNMKSSPQPSVQLAQHPGGGRHVTPPPARPCPMPQPKHSPPRPYHPPRPCPPPPCVWPHCHPIPYVPVYVPPVLSVGLGVGCGGFVSVRVGGPCYAPVYCPPVVYRERSVVYVTPPQETIVTTERVEVVSAPSSTVVVTSNAPLASSILNASGVNTPKDRLVSYTLKSGRRIGIWDATSAIENVSETCPGSGLLYWIAYSDDKGQTWRGFREALFTATSNAEPNTSATTRSFSFDECADGRFYVRLKIPNAPESMYAVDPAWLTATSRQIAPQDWMAYAALPDASGKAVGGFVQTAYAGAFPGSTKTDGTYEPALNIRSNETSLEKNITPGAVVNFPMAEIGSINFDFVLPENSAGCAVSLCDKLFSVNNLNAVAGSVYSFKLSPRETIGGKCLKAGERYTLRAVWSKNQQTCTVYINGSQVAELEARHAPLGGLRYLHLQSLSTDADIWVGKVSMRSL